MTIDEFTALIGTVAADISGKPLDANLQTYLNETYPASGEAFDAIEQACHKAIEEGWMCEREIGGIAFGRVLKPDAMHGFSVDVVRMRDVKGPHHRHPNGEIDMIMPISEAAEFDNNGRVWLVYGAETAHYPTVTGGEALVLYLLPDGAIEFTGQD